MCDTDVIHSHRVSYYSTYHVFNHKFLTVALNAHAQALAATGDLRVTFLAVTRRYQQCQEGVQAQAAAASAIRYKCLAPEHFVPGVCALSLTTHDVPSHCGRLCCSCSGCK